MGWNNVNNKEREREKEKLKLEKNRKENNIKSNQITK
jgi:hypothetical protein